METNDCLNEIRQRVTRIETRLIVLGRKLGVKLVNDDADVQVVVDSRSVYIAHLDIALTTIINKCRAAGLFGPSPVRAYYNGRLVALVEV